MEGDLLDVAMGMEDCTQPMKVVVSASVYCLKSSGNANLFKKYIEHLDNEFQQLMLFPIQAAQHWSLLTYQPGIARLCACDSGVGKLFALIVMNTMLHSSLQLSWLLVWMRARCPRTPFAWMFQCSRMPLTAVSMSS